MTNDAIRYGFMGSGHFAARCLELLCGWVMPAWVVTAPPSPAGRGLKLRPTPTDVTASSKDLQIIRSDSASSDVKIAELVRESGISFIFVIDFGQMIKQPLLDMPPMGCINIHPSLLPLYRGCAPVQRAVIDGREYTGVTVFRLIPAMDAGPVLLRKKIKIEDDDTSGSIFEKAAYAGVRSFSDFADKTPLEDWKFYGQDHNGQSYAAKIEKSECRIDWTKNAGSVVNLIRGLQPAPSAHTFICGRRLKVLKARAVPGGGEPGSLLDCEVTPVVACGEGAVELIEVQLEGKKPQGACEWLNGSRLTKEERFSYIAQES